MLNDSNITNFLNYFLCVTACCILVVFNLNLLRELITVDITTYEIDNLYKSLSLLMITALFILLIFNIFTRYTSVIFFISIFILLSYLIAADSINKKLFVVFCVACISICFIQIACNIFTIKHFGCYLCLSLGMAVSFVDELDYFINLTHNHHDFIDIFFVNLLPFILFFFTYRNLNIDKEYSDYIEIDKNSEYEFISVFLFFFVYFLQGSKTNELFLFIKYILYYNILFFILCASISLMIYCKIFGNLWINLILIACVLILKIIQMQSVNISYINPLECFVAVVFIFNSMQFTLNYTNQKNKRNMFYTKFIVIFLAIYSSLLI